MLFFIIIAFSYLLGSIPFGLLVTKFGGEGDIRTIGSGNIGATNVLRTGRKGLAIATLLLDTVKGMAAVWIAQTYAPEVAMWAGLAALIGHVFPVWLKFKGGKGVATSLGILLALEPLLGLFCALTWLATFFAFRISSLSALVAAAFAPLFAFILLGDEPVWLMTLFMSLLLIIRHKANIVRLLHGEEGKSKLKNGHA
ncbi:glycerol-3-phosphate 1-O-acyltransferase PlsY [bacterium]|nr:glycerol-3-phosphate 1-O-acyltransferase PlsY [bacterium]